MANLRSYHDEAGSLSQTSQTQFICERKFRRGPSSRNNIFDMKGEELHISYDEFCAQLGGPYVAPTETIINLGMEEEDSPTDMGRIRRYSHVQRWRTNVEIRVEVGPPVSPLIATDFPSSPVAVIDPSYLGMSWTPNYDIAQVAMASSPGLASPSMVDKPNHLHDIQDSELEDLLKQLSETQSLSGTSESDTISVYVPPAIAPPKAPQGKQKTFKTAMRWLPKRIKYTFLSATAGRSLRR